MKREIEKEKKKNITPTVPDHFHGHVVTTKDDSSLFPTT